VLVLVYATATASSSVANVSLKLASDMTRGRLRDGTIEPGLGNIYSLFSKNDARAAAHWEMLPMSSIPIAPGYREFGALICRVWPITFPGPGDTRGCIRVLNEPPSSFHPEHEQSFPLPPPVCLTLIPLQPPPSRPPISN